MLPWEKKKRGTVLIPLKCPKPKWSRDLKNYTLSTILIRILSQRNSMYVYEKKIEMNKRARKIVWNSDEADEA